MFKTISRISKDKSHLKRLNKDISLILNKHPGLMVCYVNNVPKYIHGIYRLFDNEGIEQGNWDIKILIPDNYPYNFPVLFELSNKIIRTHENHIDENGQACVELDENFKYKMKKGITISDFSEMYVSKFFSWQLLNASEYKNELQSWKHKDEGRKEFFYKVLETEDDSFVLKCLNLIIFRKVPCRNTHCFCSSGKKFKICHQRKLEELITKIGIQTLPKYLSLFSKLSTNESK